MCLVLEPEEQVQSLVDIHRLPHKVAELQSQQLQCKVRDPVYLQCNNCLLLNQEQSMSD